MLISGHQPLVLKRDFYYRTRWLRGFFDPHPDHPLPPTLQALVSLLKREAVLAAQKAASDAAEAKRHNDERIAKRAKDEAERRQRDLWALEANRARDQATEEKLRWKETMALFAITGLCIFAFAVMGFAMHLIGNVAGLIFSVGFGVAMIGAGQNLHARIMGQ